MNVKQRRAAIAERLRRDGEATIPDLAAAYGTSEMTIRRDLDQLEMEGLVRRARRGAVAVESRAYEPPVIQRASDQADAKRRIGAAVAALIGPGETVALDVGTTTLAVARALDETAGITVVTNSVLIAAELGARGGFRTYLTGGEVRPGELSLVGETASRWYEDLRCDVAVLGAAGVDESGVSEYNPDDAMVKRAALRSARRAIVAADSTKLGRGAFARVTPLGEIDLIVTDAHPGHRVVVAARRLGVDVLNVEPFASEEAP